MQLFWVGNNTLAIVGKDPFVRLWDVESGDNTVLEAKRSEVGDEETFLSVEYHPLDGDCFSFMNMLPEILKS